MESLRLISMTVFLFCLILSATTNTTKAATPVDFIRASCNDTSYPSLCYTTLSPYAPIINNNNALLAHTAISISLKKSKATAAYLKRLSVITSTPVLNDCVSTLSEAAELARDSVQHMNEIINVNNGTIKDPSKLQDGDLQTWMSAALSNQVTCIDGFEEVADGSVKADVVKRVEVTKMVTSNALAFISKFVNA